MAQNVLALGLRYRKHFILCHVYAVEAQYVGVYFVVFAVS
jgi:hypothetical protein